MKNEKFFQILKNDDKTKARMGEINTPHGKILTPAFVPVGSQASVKSLTPQDLKEIGIQVFFVNTYHLYLRPGAEIVHKLGGLHNFMGWEGPIMTDSGGFQIFSLGRASEVKIDYNGVIFRSHLNGTLHRFTPEKSMEVQKMLGADMMIAFDECAPYPITHKYAQMAMKRTHRWGLRSLAAAQTKPFRGQKQALFGVIQGSVYRDLREESAKFISNLALSGAEGFPGIAIGGVSVGESKSQMRQVLDWVMPFIPEEKPVHLLGVGEIDDVFAAIERGVDLLDCVMPTRLGRMGWILTNEKWRVDITKREFVSDPSPVESGCDCFVCQNFSKAYLNHLFRAKELLAYRLASYHNLYFMERLFEKIREAIKKDKFSKLKKQWLRE